MNAGPTSTRIYEVLRDQLLLRGYRPGTRLDPIALADELGSSPTPVRDALHILAGEDIVVALPNGGFTTATFDEQSLYDLYRWNGDVLAAALRCQMAGSPFSENGRVHDPELMSQAHRIAALCQRIADGSNNLEHVRVQARINARLHLARAAEPALIQHGEQELQILNQCFELRNYTEMRKLIRRYTSTRKQLCGKILRYIMRTGS